MNQSNLAHGAAKGTAKYKSILYKCMMLILSYKLPGIMQLEENLGSLCE